MDDALGLPPGAFAKIDSEEDELFYEPPRLVVHIDDGAIAALTDLYRALLPAGGVLLDLMSSWVSHLPPEISYAESRVDGIDLVLCHYPFRRWKGMDRGSVNLHGHSHGRLRPLLPRQFDVGVDVRGYRPVRLAELLPPPRKGAG